MGMGLKSLIGNWSVGAYVKGNFSIPFNRADYYIGWYWLFMQWSAKNADSQQPILGRYYSAESTVIHHRGYLFDLISNSHSSGEIILHRTAIAVAEILVAVVECGDCRGVAFNLYPHTVISTASATAHKPRIVIGDMNG